MDADYKLHDPKGWGGDPKRGAALGRSSHHAETPPDFEGRLYIRRVRLNSGGYDRNGTYFGVGEPIYWCRSEDCEIDFMLRADSRGTAVVKVKRQYPNSKVR
jgi:hypothetical protein